MAQWSSENFVAEYKEIQANAMAVDCIGRFALLGGRRALSLVNLQDPNEDLVRIARHTTQAKWDINSIEFSPHACTADTFVTASNQRLEVLQLTKSSVEHRCNLKAHTRTVSDIDWSPFDVHQLASCSVDTFTYLWDIREPKRPALAFQSVTGAYQVKWNKVVNNMFATTHEGDIRIWDKRKGNTPIQYVAAHISKIHGLDWHRRNQYKLVTASQDCFVRFWDITNVRRSEDSLNTFLPVWRARLTPFGNGLMTVVVPQLRRGENKLYLWNTTNLAQPIHTFVGHKDVVLEFHWRKMPEGVHDHQLITWSRDQSLRIWKIDSALLELCGQKTSCLPDVGTSQTDGLSDPKPITKETVVLPKSTATKSASPIDMPNQPQTLQQEFSLVNKNIPNVTIEEMDDINRMCRVTAQIGKRMVCLSLHFPANYPDNAAPSFQFLKTTLDSTMQKHVIKVLTETSQKQVRQNQTCLEPCLRQLYTELETLTKTERKTPDLVIPFPLTQPQPNLMQTTPNYPMSIFGSFQDSSVPFPRTSGARFCSVGLLVIFGRPADMKKVAGGTEPTPKALSELSAFAKPSQTTTAFVSLFPRSPPTPSSDVISISDYYIVKEKKHRTRSKSRVREVAESRYRDLDKTRKKHAKAGPVQIYDVSALQPINKQLAEKYRLDLSDVSGMCSHNAAAAASVGRKDLVQVWNYISVMLPASLYSSPVASFEPPFAMCPFGGRPFLKTLLDHYNSIYDVQTVAMLCCLFWNRDGFKRGSSARSVSKASMEYMPVNTDANITYLGSSTDSGWSLLPVMKSKRSNSWSESCDDYRILDDEDPSTRAAQREMEQHENNCRMLDPALYVQYDMFKKAYANILYCWGLQNQATHILKFLSTPPPPHIGIDFHVMCTKCKIEVVGGPQCMSCKHLALECVICHMGVRGAANFCIACTHGGHMQHMADWFATETECPTGCGCLCLQAAQNFEQ